MPTSTPADLDRQAAKLREQAAGLNRRNADRIERAQADLGQRLDETQRAATSARAAGDAATKQASELQDQAKQNLDTAKSFEDDALRTAAAGGPGSSLADNLLVDQAQKLRAAAIGLTGRAQRAQQEARRHVEQAERLDRDVDQIRHAAADDDRAGQTIWKTADDLDNKASQLEQAASDLREAGITSDATQKAALTKSAQDHLTRADGIKPDFDSISAEDIVGAGIPASDLPGELIDPSAADPVSPSPVDLHGTDPVDPLTQSQLDPTSPGTDPAAVPDPVAAAVASPGAGADADTVTGGVPGIDPVTGIGGVDPLPGVTGVAGPDAGVDPLPGVIGTDVGAGLTGVDPVTGVAFPDGGVDLVPATSGPPGVDPVDPLGADPAGSEASDDWAATTDGVVDPVGTAAAGSTPAGADAGYVDDVGDVQGQMAAPVDPAVAGYADAAGTSTSGYLAETSAVPGDDDGYWPDGAGEPAGDEMVEYGA